MTSESFKVLGQLFPSVNTLTALYTVPNGLMASCSSISVCNQSSSTTANIRVSVAVNGAADDPTQYLYYDLPVVINDTFVATVGLSLNAGDVVRVQTDLANVSFNLFGAEVTP